MLLHRIEKLVSEISNISNPAFESTDLRMNKAENAIQPEDDE